MVRFKHRYIVLEIVPHKKWKKPLSLNEYVLYKTVIGVINKLHGDFGEGAIKPGFVTKYCNAYTRIVFIRVRHGPHKLLTSALPFVKQIDSTPCTLKTLHTGASLKQCYRFIKKYQLSKIEEEIGSLKSHPNYKDILTEFLDISPATQIK